MSGNRTALVTGANKGIGLAIARGLAEKGFKVFLTARDAERGERAVSLIKGKHPDIEFVQLDVSDAQSVAAAAHAVAARVSSLHVLVNNAAILEDDDRSVAEVDIALVRSSFEVNTLGPLLVTQQFAPLLLKSGRGRVVNLSSGAGSLQDMEGGWPAYSISKAALHAVTRQFAILWERKKVTVNAVCPGWVNTDMGGDAPRTPEQGADTALWLAAEAPDNVTGRFLRDRKVIPW